ncbi:MAG: MotA/TolQ/ExbB proton channel family protein [Deltaproteobacteria bacterium]|nr:MotA/TolQ/ExbB proton channel family protein [Deltaproteobacteria bacterium]
MDIQQRLTAFALLGATWVMWLLVVLSVIGLAVILERAYYMIVSRGNIDRLRKALQSDLEKNDVESAQKSLTNIKSLEARIARVVLESAANGAEVARERMAAEQQILKIQMERNLVFLGTVGNNAPFVGLLGTVIGIIRAFHTLDDSAGKVTAGLMADIGEALVATAIGILVALPAVAAYNTFQRIIKTRLARAEALGDYIIAYLKTNHDK